MWSLPKPLRLAPLLILAACSTPQVQTKSSLTLTPPSTKIPTSTSATSAAPVVDPLCSSLTLIYASRLDTDGTKTQIATYNAIVTKVCGAH